MFRRTKVCSGVLVALGGALSLGSAPVFGLSRPSNGSRSRARRSAASTPRAAFRSGPQREDIERTGATSVVDLLQKLPAVQGATGEASSRRRRHLRLLRRLDPQHRRDPHPGAAKRPAADPVRRPDPHRLRRRRRPELDPDRGDRARRDPDRRRLRAVRSGCHRRRGQLHHQARHHRGRRHIGLSYPQHKRCRREALQRLQGFRSLDKDSYNVFAS